MHISISGVGAVPVTRELSRPIPDLCAQVAREAMADAGLGRDDIDGLFVTPAAMSGEPWLMWAANLSAFLGIPTRHLGLYENGGASSMLALRSAMDAVASGRIDHALVIASDTRPDFDSSRYEAFLRVVTQQATALYGPFHAIMGLGTPIPIYAMSAQRYQHEYGATDEDLARVSVRLRGHASEHPLAQFRKPITVEEVLSSRLLSPPIRLLQAAGISSGACAVVVSRGQGVPITGYGEYHDPSHFIPRDAPLTRFVSVVEAASEAFSQAGRRPEQVDVAEIYGVFAATELMLYEDLGFCEKGEGAAFANGGHTTWGGDLVVNPTGGRISFGHPAGATPIYELIEVVRQLRGDAPGRQVPGARVGLVHAEHGMMNGSVVMLLEAA